MPTIKVLVVEDSATIRGRLRSVLGADPEIEVAAEATTGTEAIELCRRYRPDVITMDMVLPGLDGLAATEHIMAHWPTPILIVSSSTNRAQLFSTYDALAAGAVDVLEKPRGGEHGSWEQRLLSTVKIVSRIHVITHHRTRSSTAGQPGGVGPGRRRCDLIAVGASAGGPAAVVDLLRELPPALGLPVLVVQHITAPFDIAFADWLARQIRRPVAYAQAGAPVAPTRDQVTVAPPGSHLTVERGRMLLTHAPERHSCRPSVDVLFESVADEYGDTAAACLLTGMGVDGAAGLLRVRRAGGLTFAQDEATSIVYGMPREAARLHAATHILPADQIGRQLASLVPPGATPGSGARR